MSQPHAQWVPSPTAGGPGEEPLLEIPAPRSKAVKTEPPKAAFSPAVTVIPANPLDWRVLAPKVAAAVLGTLAVIEGAHITWDLMHMPKVPLAAAQSITPVVRATHGLRLSSAHLFGMEPTAAEQAAVIARSRPINWVLTGVIASRDGQGVAIVGEAGKIEVVRTGDAIPGMPGSRLAEVAKDHVVIDRQGLMQNVELPRQRGLGRMAGPAPMPVPEAEAMPSAPPSRQMRPSAGTESLLSSLNPEPRPDANGRFSGMTLHPTVLMQRQFGMRDGDLLTQINGQPLNEPDSVANALKSAAAGETVTVTFTHAGVEQTVTLPVVN